MKKSNLISFVIILVLLGITYYQQNVGGSGGPIPDYAMEVLEEVRETSKAPNGYVGGRTFQNREKRLPKKDASGKKTQV